MANIPTNIRDIIFINGFVNIINKPTHFDNRTGNYSLLDSILITDSISIIDSDTIHIDREFSQSGIKPNFVVISYNYLSCWNAYSSYFKKY
jgi:hypothetical protein